MVPTVKLVAVDDTPAGLDLLAEALQQDGLAIFTSTDPEEGLELIYREHPHIVLLDWMLPGRQGSDVCTAIREKGYDKLVIMMTAKAQDIDKIEAYNFGVSDYITKPFNMDVLVAMIDNKIKFSLNSEKSEAYKFANMEHHPNMHLLIRDGKKIELTILENRILLYFLKKRNKVINREELMMEVWGYNADVNTRTLDMHIVRLRKKIENNPDSPQYLQTVRGIGYKFAYEG